MSHLLRPPGGVGGARVLLPGVAVRWRRRGFRRPGAQPDPPAPGGKEREGREGKAGKGVAKTGCRRRRRRRGQMTMKAAEHSIA